MSAHNSKLFRIQQYIHTIFWSSVLICAGVWLTFYMLSTLGDPLNKQTTMGGITLRSEQRASAMGLTEKTVTRRLGEWEFSEPVIPGHFHHIGSWYESDTSNFCVDCHGWLPHSRSEDMRSFLNMHAAFTDCMVCHVNKEENRPPTQFSWRNIDDGTLSKTVNMSGKSWGEYGAKIMPVDVNAQGATTPWSLKEEESLAVNLRKQEPALGMQQAVSSKMIHRRCVEKPVQCNQCHTKKDPLINFSELGYDHDRAEFLMSAEVIGLLDAGKVFHLPKLLSPDIIERNRIKKPAKPTEETLDNEVK